MGQQAEETLDVSNYDDFSNYLRAHTRVFMELQGKTYYLTHTDGYWRAQDCATLNDKGHFTDCSELVPTLDELLRMKWLPGELSVHDAFSDAAFFRSIQK